MSLRTYLGVFTLSAAALILESSLTRLLAVAQYYHFAFLVVSLALLGFGASGSLLTLFPRWLFRTDQINQSQGRGRLLVISGVGFGSSLILAYGVMNWLPFDSYSIAWDQSQVLYFVIYYFVLTLPFLFAGLGIGAVLSSSPGENNRVYAVNLIGSAFGVLVGLLVMNISGVPGAIIVSGGLGLSAVLIANDRIPRSGLWVVWGLLAICSTAVILLSVLNHRFKAPAGITISPYKGLPYALQTRDASWKFGAWNAISRIDVVSGTSTHSQPGLSYTYQEMLPEQIAMAFDGDALRPITLTTPESFKAADYLPEAAAFQLHPGGKALVLDAGSGLGVLQALASGAGQVTAINDNRLVTTAIQNTAPEYDVYHNPLVEVVYEPERTFLAAHRAQFDIILQPLNDPYRPVANGAYSLSESYDLTVESYISAISNLSPDGVLVVTRWLQTPPSEGLRLFATLIEALNRLGIENAGDSLVAYRGIQTLTMLLQPAGWSDKQLALIREFTSARKFDLVWTPDIIPEEVNRFNKLDEDVYFNSFRGLINSPSKSQYYADYPYAVQPTNDDYPFFFHFFKWEQTPQVFAMLGRVWQPFGGSGYFMLVALLLLVTLLSCVLIFAPLLIHRRLSKPGGNPPSQDRTDKFRISPIQVLIYFGSIGVAFLFIEIPLIQKSILSMGHPAYAFSFVVLVIMVASGLGSIASRKFWKIKGGLMLLLIGFAVLTLFSFPLLQDATLGWSPMLRALCLGISIFPLGILMGFPFSFGLEWLERAGSDLTPWAWAVNGCASVIAAVLAAIISLSKGFTIVLVIGAVFYGVAAITIHSKSVLARQGYEGDTS
jgi:hypothetical protein